MNETKKTDSTNGNGAHDARDAETHIVLGIFITFISLPVICGTYWADRLHAMVVNLVAGFVLMAIGIVMLYWGLRKKKNLSS